MKSSGNRWLFDFCVAHIPKFPVDHKKVSYENFCEVETVL